MAAPTPRPPKAGASQVGSWEIEYTDANGDQAFDVVEGKLVLQDEWTLVLDPASSAVLFAVPNENTAKVQPS